MAKKRSLTMGDFKSFKFSADIEGKYSFGEVLGQGNFGVVRQCVHRDSSKTVAIKTISKSLIQTKKIYKELLDNELSILSKKSHPYLIRIIDLLEDNSNFYIVSEHVKGGELFHRLARLTKFTEQ